MFASSFDILYLFKFSVLIFDQEKGTHDNPHYFEGLKNAIKKYNPWMDKLQLLLNKQHTNI